MTEQTKFLVDFNSRDEKDYVPARLSIKNRQDVRVGMKVISQDDEQHTCEGIIKKIQDNYALIKMDWDTFTNPGTIEIQRAEG